MAHNAPDRRGGNQHADQHQHAGSAYKCGRQRADKPGHNSAQSCANRRGAHKAQTVKCQNAPTRFRRGFDLNNGARHCHIHAGAKPQAPAMAQTAAKLVPTAPA